MKKLFLGKHAKNLAGRAAALLITGLIAATTLLAASPVFAHSSVKSLNAASLNTVTGSAGPALHQDPRPSCKNFNATLEGTNPYTLTTGNRPFPCDRVDWIFPNTDKKTCTFQSDGNFTPQIVIDFYDYRDGAPTDSDHKDDSPITHVTVNNSGTFTARGTNIVHAHLRLEKGDDQKEITLGNIKYTCRPLFIASPSFPFSRFFPFSS